MQAYIGNIKIDHWKRSYEPGYMEIGPRYSEFFGPGPVRGLKISVGPGLVRFLTYLFLVRDGPGFIKLLPTHWFWSVNPL